MCEYFTICFHFSCPCLIFWHPIITYFYLWFKTNLLLEYLKKKKTLTSNLHLCNSHAPYTWLHNDAESTFTFSEWAAGKCSYEQLDLDHRSYITSVVTPSAPGYYKETCWLLHSGRPFYHPLQYLDTFFFAFMALYPHRFFLPWVSQPTSNSITHTSTHRYYTLPPFTIPTTCSSCRGKCT